MAEFCAARTVRRGASPPSTPPTPPPRRSTTWPTCPPTPTCAARGAIVEVDGVPMQGLVARLSATPGAVRWAGRPLGADDPPAWDACPGFPAGPSRHLSERAPSCPGMTPVYVPRHGRASCSHSPVTTLLAVPIAALGVSPPRAAAAVPHRAVLLRVRRGLGVQQGGRDLQRHRRPRRPGRRRLHRRAVQQRCRRPQPVGGATGTVADGDVFVLSRADADPAIVAQADQLTPAVANWNGDDAVVAAHGPARWSTSSARSGSTPAASGAPAPPAR